MSVRKEIFQGVSYIAISKYLGIIVSLFVAGILGRLIVPEDFGVVAIATVIISFFNIFSNLGITPAIIQKKDLSEKEITDIFCFTFYAAIILTFIFFCTAGPISIYYNSPILLTICRILSIQLFFITLNIVPNALLLKDKKFKFIAVRNLIIQFIGGTSAIIAAFSGLGLYALIINPIFTSIAIFFAGIREYPQKLYLSLGLKTIRKIFSYSIFQFLFELINYFNYNLDKLLIGRFMGARLLGYYEKSYKLMMLPMENIAKVITPVIHPIFSNFQNDIHQLSFSYLKIVRLLAFIGFPLSVFLFFTAKEITLLIFGMQWIKSVPIFQILSLSVGVQMVMSTSHFIFQSANSTKILFISGILSFFSIVTGIVVGIFIFDSLDAVAWGICIAFFINFFQCYILMYRVVFRVDMRPFFKQFISPLFLTLIFFLIIYFVDYHLDNSLSMLFTLTIKGILFACLFVFYIQITKEFDIFGRIRFYFNKFFSSNERI